MIMAGGKLRKQRAHGFCFFVSILDLFGFPSLVLGIFTLIVLIRPTVKELFQGGGPCPPSQPLRPFRELPSSTFVEYLRLAPLRAGPGANC